ncbi:MAG: Holliday junction branch migration protein RuvA [Treponema sp.]|jgi:Holliday junction DNA helicase RuvA|nr:Holliday junction branch migration protein RuvA [Treponema sp.]
MFNSIQGRVTGKHADGLRLCTGGIEWDLAVPLLDQVELPPAGEEGRVFTWLYHREDQMKLYGFSSEKRRATFLELLKVEGIGPKGALRIMGGIGQEELEAALEAGDLDRLERVPGLGKKTAQKMLLALKGKLARLDEDAQGGPYGDLAEALANMGYDKRAAAEALAKASAGLKDVAGGAERETQLLKRAIVLLSGSRDS